VYRSPASKSTALADNPRVRALAVAVLPAFLLAAAVRLPGLGSRSLASAEQAAFVESQGFSTTADIPDRRPLDAAALPRRSGPSPLDVAALAWWTRLAGDSEAALRLPSALAGVLTAVLVALVAARLAGPRAAAWAGALVALSPIHSLASRQVGPESPLVLAIALALLLLVRVETLGARPEAIALGLLLGALAANGTAAPAGFALLAVAWLALRPDRRPSAVLAGAAGLVVLAGAALAGRLRSPLDFGTIPSWVPGTTLAGTVRCAGASFTRVAGLEYQLVVSRALEVIPLTALFVGLMALGAARVDVRKRALLVAGAALPFLLGLALAPAVGRVTPLQAHRTLAALPFVAVLMAVGLASLRGSRAWAAGVGVAGTVAAFLALALLRPASETSPASRTAREVALCRAGTVVVDRPLDLLTLAAWGVTGPFDLHRPATPAPAGPGVRVGPSSTCVAGGASCGTLPRCPSD
jgi:4-amino-4-deoxy-L-arabinose transferase-like glycosyltransferase